MAATDTRYQSRFGGLPHLIEMGRDETLSCPVYLSGALAAPSSGTVTIYDASSTVVATGAVTVSASIATYTLTDAVVSATYTEPQRGWWAVWVLTMPDGVAHRFRNTAALVRYRLYPSISDVDLIGRWPALDPASSTVITTSADYQWAIDAVDLDVQRRLIRMDRRPALIADPTALSEVWLYGAYALILEDLAIRDEDAYAVRAAEARARYERAWAEAAPLLDYDEDGAPDTVAPVKIAPSVVWTC